MVSSRGCSWRSFFASLKKYVLSAACSIGSFVSVSPGFIARSSLLYVHALWFIVLSSQVPEKKNNFVCNLCQGSFKAFQ